MEQWVGRMAPERRRMLLRGLGLLVVACAAIGGAVVGLARAQDYARSLPVYQRPLRIELADVPEWFSRLGLAAHVLGELEVQPSDRLLDDELV